MNDMRPIALVTGGAKRLGRAIALALGQAGMGVAIHYNGSDQDAQETCSAVKALGVPSAAFKA